jgi:hypothetical protein
MNVLARTRAGGRAIECGLAATRRTFARVQAQPFRTDQRHRYQPVRLIHEQPSVVGLFPPAHPDPVVPVPWLVAEIAASIEQATSMYDFRYTPVSVPNRSTRHGNEPQGRLDDGETDGV